MACGCQVKQLHYNPAYRRRRGDRSYMAFEFEFVKMNLLIKGSNLIND